MSRFKGIQWWIEWSPGAVRAVDGAGAVHEAADLTGLKGRVSGNAIVLLGRRSSFVRAVRLPNARSSEIAAIARLQATQIFPSVQGELAFGHVSTNDVSSEGRLTLLVAAPVATLERIYAEAQPAGIRVMGALPISLGAVPLARAANVDHGAVADMGVDGLGIDLVHAGCLVYSRPASDAGDIAAEFDRAFLAAQIPPGPRILAKGLSGEGAILTSQSTVEALIGTAHEFESATLELPSEVRRRERATVNNRARLAILVAVAAMVVCFLIWNDRQEALGKVKKAQALFTKDLRGLTNRRESALRTASNVKSALAEVKRAFEPVQPMSDVINVISNSVPADVWLTGVNYERGKPLLLRGVARSNEAVGVLLDTLTANERFRDVKLVFANQAMIESTNVVQFSMSAHVVGNLPTVKTKQERKKK